MKGFEHYFLIKSQEFDSACLKIRKFLDRYELLSYDRLEFDPRASRNGSDPAFKKVLEEIQARNREIIKGLLEEFSRKGYSRLEDLAEIPQGYLSKLFHTLAHLLDGFLGIDSYFYNLEEDSHWVSPKMEQELSRNPESFWLIKVCGFTSISETKFEILSPPSKRIKLE
ncbi:hypothetical protein [Thermosulfurimonas dismutans]|uniref:Uncharacterized protein n=1 Tax=Thermosulfurimonas dismutans TaxID=999894 RepID=A0A179D3A8_9BACT|nr:hypothetical protein [Thermosulfurimonas dismutans]OAQ20545.1 hypothetical protein TDIS_1314 [Thermosulfurimonas dismutans]